jgi:hypothetical protein
VSNRHERRARRRDHGPTAGGLLDTIHREPDRCPVCGEGHHRPLFPVTKATEAVLGEPAVQDTINHATTEVWRVMKEYGLPEDRWLEVLEPVASALGFVVAAGEHFGRRHAMQLFWQGLVEEQGFGTYVLELGPNGPVASRPS